MFFIWAGYNISYFNSLRLAASLKKDTSKKEEIGGRQFLERKDDHDGGVRPGFIFRVPGTVVKTNNSQKHLRSCSSQ